jgi:hypothetical protein
MEPVESKKEAKRGESGSRRRRGASTPAKDPEVDAKEAAAKAALIKVAAATEAAKAAAESAATPQGEEPSEPAAALATDAGADSEPETAPLV